MPQPMPRFLDRELMLREQARTLARILLEVGEAAPPFPSAGTRRRVALLDLRTANATQ